MKRWSIAVAIVVAVFTVAGAVAPAVASAVGDAAPMPYCAWIRWGGLYYPICIG